MDYSKRSELSSVDVELIGATGLSTIDKHYLRLLAHCLTCFHAIADGAKSGPLPSHDLRFEWCIKQPSFVKEKPFIPVFLEQLEVAGHYLEELALTEGITPLALQTEDLIKAMSKSAAEKNSLNEN